MSYEMIFLVLNYIFMLPFTTNRIEDKLETQHLTSAFFSFRSAIPSKKLSRASNKIAILTYSVKWDERISPLKDVLLNFKNFIP